MNLEDVLVHKKSCTSTALLDGTRGRGATKCKVLLVGVID